ncbi:calcium-binding protein [Phaeobacter marinintestinus]|uniref:calcium-binding protein n=1 Tax=Falsiphaeobacter marinintestinus TaxID=1492905 RepID=UPI0011B66738|nr:hypothetical protein [Phaeobacter marinintestinus]
MPTRTSSQTTIAIGGEFQINTYTPDDQFDQVVTALVGGGFVVSWESEGQDGENLGVIAQVYDATGAAIGAEIAVNETTTGYQYDPRVIALEGGGFVVGWYDTSLNDGSPSTPDYYDVSLRVYAADGTPVTGEFVANDPGDRLAFTNDMSLTALPGGGFLAAWSAKEDRTMVQTFDADGVPVGEEYIVELNAGLFQGATSAATLTDGGYVVAWETYNAGIRSVTFSADGTPLSVNAQVTQDGDYRPSEPVVTALTGGGYTVTWITYGRDGSSTSVHTRVFDSAGTPTTPEMQVNTTVESLQYLFDVAALVDGGFVATWLSTDDGSGDIHAQVFDASGSPVGGEIAVNAQTEGSQTGQSVAALDNGGFIVTWSSTYDEDGYDYGIYMQAFDADGTKVGDEMLVNTTVDYRQFDPVIETLENGDFVVTWESEHQDGDDQGVFGQVFSVNAVSTGDPILVGNAGTGVPLTVDTSSIADLDGLGDFSYQWQRDGEDVVGQTRARYIVGEDDVGSTLTVTVTYTDGQGTIEAIVSDASDVVTLYRIKGDNTANTLVGSDDVNVIYGYNGGDTLIGLGGNDTLIGGVRDDWLEGGDDDDLLRGDLNDDTLFGGAGQDRMVGGKGDDVQTGGAGADVFMFRGTDFGTDVITDFELGVDRLLLAESVDTSSDVTSNGDGDAVLTLSEGTITFEGITAADLIGYFDTL